MVEVIKEFPKSIDQIEAELDKEFYEEFIKLVEKYKRTFAPKLAVVRLKKEELEKIKK